MPTIVIGAFLIPNRNPEEVKKWVRDGLILIDETYLSIDPTDDSFRLFYFLGATNPPDDSLSHRVIEALLEKYNYPIPDWSDWEDVLDTFNSFAQVFKTSC